MTKTLLYLPCADGQIWLVAGKGAAAEAEDEASLEAAAVAAGWEVGKEQNWCPKCVKERARMVEKKR